MPYRPQPYCSVPWCPDRAIKKGKCLTHQQGYDKQWNRLRADYLEDNFWCEHEGCTKPATEVDHIDGSGPKGNNTWSNLRALCKPHHSAKTHAQMGLGRWPNR